MCRDFSLINRPPPAAMAAWSRQFASGLVRLFTQSDRRCPAQDAIVIQGDLHERPKHD